MQKYTTCAKYAASLALIALSQHALAGWKAGQVQLASTGYDGTTIVFRLDGFDKTNCTCYPALPSYFCLDPTRATYKYEAAALLAAKTSGKKLSVHIDDVTCKVQALELLD